VLAQTRADLYNKPTGINLLAGGLTVLLFVVASVGLVGYFRNSRNGKARAAEQYFLFLVYGTVVFQVIHTLEHILQAGFWVRHPYSFPWLSPWALAAQRGLTTFFDPQARLQSGNEVLHLLGNGVFFAGLVAMVDALKKAGVNKSSRRWATWAYYVEGFHLIEHALLTSTWYLFGIPRGVTTYFGLAYKFPSPWASGNRILWHFVLNLVPTVLVLGGVGELRRAGLLKENGLARVFSRPGEAALEGTPAR